jgi:hypothetical protein
MRRNIPFHSIPFNNDICGLSKNQKINICKNLNCSSSVLLKVFENKVMRRAFGPYQEEVSGGWGKLLGKEH